MKRKYSAGIFILTIVIGVAIVIGHNVKRYYFDKEYLVDATTACDPSQHSCFMTDPNTPNPNLPIPVYERIEVDAAYAPTCLDEHTCKTFSCEGVKAECTITYCSEDSLADGEACTGTSH